MASIPERVSAREEQVLVVLMLCLVGGFVYLFIATFGRPGLSERPPAFLASDRVDGLTEEQLIAEAGQPRSRRVRLRYELSDARELWLESWMPFATFSAAWLGSKPAAPAALAADVALATELVATDALIGLDFEGVTALLGPPTEICTVLSYDCSWFMAGADAALVLLGEDGRVRERWFDY